jgi:hypothetical protein
MKTIILAIAAPLALILVMSACNLPVSQNNSNHNQNMALTITAQALIIQNSTNQSTIKHTHPRSTPTVVPDTTPGAPMVSVSSSTNCRTGPSTDYDLLYTLAVGQTAEVVGKYSGGNYWVINNPNGVGNCWLWGQYATIIGNTDNLPDVVPPPAPPTAVAAIPADTAVPTALPTLNYHINKPHVVLPFFLPTATPTINWKIVKSLATLFKP